MFLEQSNRLEDEKWKSAYAFFERAMELPAADRLAFSQQEIQDPDVLRLVLQLLKTATGTHSGNLSSPGSPRFHPGEQYGRFALEELLGRGGMGEVYSARDTELHRGVALKFVSAQCIGNSGLVERLVREARAASALNHPGIVTVHEVMRSEDSLAIVMERVDGIALRSFCGRANPAEQVARWGTQITGALAAAHAGGVVHRDIKPENLMVRPDGYVKVLDFGVAVQIGTEDDLAGIPIGTLGYMSPEQIQGKPLTGASDVFSLGVVLAELAGGRHPFLQDTAVLTSRAIRMSEPFHVTPNQFRIAEPLGSLLRSMLAKDPRERPSAAAAGARLAAIAQPSAGNTWRRWTVAAALTLGASLAALALIPRDNGTSAPPPRIVPFTSYEGIERNPSFSPDGNSIAFSWNGPDQKNWDIYVKAIGEDVPRRLTNDPAEDFNPVWSPDGRQIAFLRRTPDSSMPLIVIVPAAGGPEREVVRMAPFVSNSVHPLAWWPDGKSLVFRKVFLTPDANTLYRRLLDTGEEYALAYRDTRSVDSQPAPIDEDRLALVRNANSLKSALCVAARGKDAQCLPAGELIDGIVLQPDRKSLLYAAESAIWRVPVRGNGLGSPTRLLDGSFPDLTGDLQGKRLAFTKSYTDLNIWKISPGSPSAEKNAEKLIASSAEDADPEYSPDGLKIAFTSNRSGHSEVYVCDQDGTGVRQLTSLRGNAASPAWSPDGRWIAFDALTDAAPLAKLYVIPAAGGSPRRLATGDQGAAIFPVWSRDGAWIYYSVGRLGFWKIPWEGGTPVPIVKGGGGKSDARLSPDGQSAYFMAQAGVEGGVHRLDFVSRKVTIIAGTDRAIYRNWALGKDGIYFVADTAPSLLQFLSFKTRRVRPVAKLPGKPNARKRGLALSPDGSSLLYTSIDTEIGDIMLIEGIR